ncbi:conjugal transfer protein TrbL family protein, partial [Streptosporangium algeriense]
MPSAPGFSFGIGGWIGNAITTWFADLVTMAIKPLLDLLAVTLLATPSVERQGRIWDLCQATTAIANGAFVMFVVVGGMLTMTYETVQSRYAIKEILPRLVVAFLAVNASFVITAKSIDVANALSAALLGQGFDARRAANAIKFLIIPPGNSQIFYVLLALVAVILLVLLLITFVLRAALTSVLVIAAPLALACVALPQTEGLARLWWRGFSGLLLIQICQSLTLVTAVRIFFNQDGREAVGLASTGQLYNLLLALVLLIILVRIPGWVSRAIFLPHGGRSSMVGRIVKTAIAYKLASPVLNVLHLRRGGGRKAVTGAARGAATKALVGKAVTGAATGGAGV